MIIDFKKQQADRPSPSTLKEGDVFHTLGWFVIEELCTDASGTSICYLRQPRHSIDDFQTYLHPLTKQTESIAENNLRYNLMLEKSYFKVISIEKDQLLAVQCNIHGQETASPYYIEFNPKTAIAMPEKILSAKAKPLQLNFGS